MTARQLENGDDNGSAFSRAAQLTSDFYSWERRGRGWDVWPHPVQLEPPFRPFGLVDTNVAPLDDARKPTFLSTLFDRLFGGRLQEAAERIDFKEPIAAQAYSYEFEELRVVLAPDVKVAPEAAEHFLVSLSTCNAPVSFEVVGTAESVSIQIACAVADADHVRSGVQAYFPEAVISDSADTLREIWSAGHGDPLIVEFGLSQEFMRPLKSFSKFDVDPLISVVGALADLADGEVALLQILFHATREPWSEHIVRSVTNWQGDAFFIDAPELVTLAEKKISAPLFAVNVRAAVRSRDTDRSWQLAKRIGGALGQVANPPHNELIALENSEECSPEAQVANLVRRQTQRTGMLLNSSELVSLVHPPSTSVRSTRLTREHRRTKLAPKALLGHELILGENTHGQGKHLVTVDTAQRLRHMHVIGASGTGKSTFLLNLIAQDMQNGRGLAVLDPHGQLVDDVLDRVPEHRMTDVVLVDPADIEFPVGLNILSAHSELEKTLLASDLVAVFRRLSTTWGDQMTSILSNAVLAFLESSRGGTLADLRRFLVEAEFRSDFLASVGDPEVVYFWQKEFPLLTGRPQASLLTRLDTFLRPRPIRAMVTQQQSLDFGQIMNDGKILLVRLAQGAIGEENAALLGSLFVSKIHQMALSRQALQESERRPFIVYADEFAQFVTPSMATLLTGARKYGIGLVLAHQELRQLLNQDRDVAGAVLANTATRVCFRVGDDDARKLEDGFASFTARDIQNLGIGQAICRIERADWDFSLSTPAAPSTVTDHASAIREISRARYGTDVGALRQDPVPAAQKERPEALGRPDVLEQPSAAKAEHTIAAQEAAIQKRARASPAAEPSSGTGAVTRQPSAFEPIVKPQGRGGAQHRYLQELIRRFGEANEWKVTLEKEILAGLGRVDVVLERPGLSVACEIGISESVEHEIENLQKCFSADFAYTVSVIAEKRFGERLKKRLATVLPNAGDRIRVLSPDELFEFLTGVSAARGRSERTVRGYKVRTSAAVSGAGPRFTKTIVSALLRMRK